MYATLKPTGRDGKIRLLDQIALPENTHLLVTVLDDYLDSSGSSGICSKYDANSSDETSLSRG